MEHVNDITLLDYVGGRLPAAEADHVRRHLAECSACAARYRDTLAMWDALGEWRVDSSAHQIADRIEELTTKAEPTQDMGKTVLMPIRVTLFAALRIAAAIIIAISAGYALGMYTAPRNVSTPPAAETTPRYLAALDFQWSSDLTWTVLQEDTSGGANRQ